MRRFTGGFPEPVVEPGGAIGRWSDTLAARRLADLHDMRNYFDANFESVIPLQAARPMRRPLALLLAASLAVLLVGYGALVWDEGKKKKKKGSRPSQPVLTQPASGR